MNNGPLPGGKEIASEKGYKLLYYPLGQHEGQVIGWSQQYDEDGRPLEHWESTNFGTPFQAIEVYSGLRKKLLQAATGEL